MPGGGLPGQVRGDASRLALWSRLSSKQNAGGDGPAMLQLAVTDQGPGIPAGFREWVFEKFFRVEHQLGNNSNGVRATGIGAVSVP